LKNCALPIKRTDGDVPDRGRGTAYRGMGWREFV
jgi:hypothetical protein